MHAAPGLCRPLTTFACVPGVPSLPLPTKLAALASLAPQFAAHSLCHTNAPLVERLLAGCRIKVLRKLLALLRGGCCCLRLGCAGRCRRCQAAALLLLLRVLPLPGGPSARHIA